jgi:hypothetical protein
MLQDLELEMVKIVVTLGLKPLTRYWININPNIISMDISI